MARVVPGMRPAHVPDGVVVALARGTQYNRRLDRKLGGAQPYIAAPSDLAKEPPVEYGEELLVTLTPEGAQSLHAALSAHLAAPTT